MHKLDASGTMYEVQQTTKSSTITQRDYLDIAGKKQETKYSSMNPRTGWGKRTALTGLRVVTPPCWRDPLPAPRPCTRTTTRTFVF